MTITQPTVDEARVHAFAGQVLTDHAAAASSALVYLGRRLGLYREMSDGEPTTAAGLAERTGTSVRYVREWLLNQVASGYVRHVPETGMFVLPVEHAACWPTPRGLVVARTCWPATGSSLGAVLPWYAAVCPGSLAAGR